VLDSLELAIVILSAINPDGGTREHFVETTGIDPNLITQGRGRRAARVLQGVVAVMRARAGSPRAANQRAEPDDETRVENIRGADNRGGEAEVQEVHVAVGHGV
jgi:hypothetical protein